MNFHLNVSCIFLIGWVMATVLTHPLPQSVDVVVDVPDTSPVFDILDIPISVSSPVIVTDYLPAEEVLFMDTHHEEVPSVQVVQDLSPFPQVIGFGDPQVTGFTSEAFNDHSVGLEIYRAPVNVFNIVLDKENPELRLAVDSDTEEAEYFPH